VRRPGLTPFFEASSVAVIGASADPSKVGGSVLANLRAGGFPGRLIVVNANRPVVQGLPAVASILDVSEPVDLAVVAVPAPAVLGTLKQCVTKGVPAAIVISAGFRESGDEGRAREAELRAAAQVLGLREVVFLDYQDGALDRVIHFTHVARPPMIHQDLHRRRIEAA